MVAEPGIYIFNSIIAYGLILGFIQYLRKLGTTDIKPLKRSVDTISSFWIMVLLSVLLLLLKTINYSAVVTLYSIDRYAIQYIVILHYLFIFFGYVWLYQQSDKISVLRRTGVLSLWIFLLANYTLNIEQIGFEQYEFVLFLIFDIIPICIIGSYLIRRGKFQQESHMYKVSYDSFNYSEGTNPMVMKKRLTQLEQEKHELLSNKEAMMKSTFYHKMALVEKEIEDIDRALQIAIDQRNPSSIEQNLVTIPGTDIQVRYCCYYAARLNESYCMCGRGVPHLPVQEQ